MAGSASKGVIALNRFGYGSRGDGDIAAAASDPRGFLEAELRQPGIALLEGSGLPSSIDALQTLFNDQDRRLAIFVATTAMTSGGSPAPPGMMALAPTPSSMAQPEMAKPDMAAPAAAAPKPPPTPQAIVFRAEAQARFQRAAQARAGLVERLVAFWANHFCVSVQKDDVVRISAGAFEREAIRPYVLGRFADMLRAVEKHPAMLFFLDNQQSMGAHSQAGQNRKKDVNENLAREIMELHTLGVNGGYTQADVGALARIISGWTYAGRVSKIAAPGTPIFFANYHEPGPQTLLGKTYTQPDREQGYAALDDLARNPATALHIATKLVRHFIADDPPPAVVARVAKTFSESDGDLMKTTLALIHTDEAWSTPPVKIRSPYEFIIAVMRMTGRVPPDVNPTLGALNVMGQPLWAPAGPNGFADTVATWASPEGIKVRLDIAAQIAARFGDVGDPQDILNKIAGDAALPETRQAIARAESRQQAMALLLMSPDVQRR